MGQPVRRGAQTTIAEHGHTGRNDGGLLNAGILLGQVPQVSASNIKTSGLTAAVTTTNLVVAPPPGLWEVLIYVEIVTKTANGTVTVTLAWTDNGGAQTDATTTLAVTAAGQRITGKVLCEIASGNLTYAVAVGTFTGSYNIRLVPVRLV